MGKQENGGENALGAAAEVVKGAKKELAELERTIVGASKSIEEANDRGKVGRAAVKYVKAALQDRSGGDSPIASVYDAVDETLEG